MLNECKRPGGFPGSKFLFFKEQLGKPESKDLDVMILWGKKKLGA